MGIIRTGIIAGAVGIGVVAWNGGATRDLVTGATEQARTAGEQALALKRLCDTRPDLCRAITGTAPAMPQQDAQRRHLTTGSTLGAPAGIIADFPDNPPAPLPRPVRRPDRG